MSKIRMNKEQAAELRAQIGAMNLTAISGGRFWLTNGSAVLPVSNGYSVVIELDSDDTYTVRRLFTRKKKGESLPTVYTKGERTHVYCDEVSEAAYYASCFRSYDENEWVTK